MHAIKTLDDNTMRLVRWLVDVTKPAVDNLNLLKDLVVKEELADKKEHQLLKDALTHNQEGLLLFLMNKCETSLTIESPSGRDGYSLLTFIDMSNSMFARQYVDLLDTKTGNTVGLSLVDAYDDELEDDELIKRLSLYLYGNPNSDDWTDKQVIHFSDLEALSD